MNEEEVSKVVVTIDKDKVVDRVNSLKKVRTDKGRVEEVIDKLINYINYFNSLTEFQEIIWDTIPIDNVPVLNEFKDFVLPSVIRRDVTDRKTKDVLVRRRDSEFGSLLDYINTCDEIRGWFKSDASGNVTKLSDLKKAVNIDAIIGRVIYKARVAYYGSPYVPIYTNLNLEDQFEDRYFNAELEDILKDWYSNLKFF